MSNISKSKFKRCLRCGRKIAVKGDYCKACEDKIAVEKLTEEPKELKPPYCYPEFQKIQQQIEDTSHFKEKLEQFFKQFYKEHPQYLKPQTKM